MKIDDILNLNGRDLLSMSEKELKAIANALTSASNKRIRRIESAGVGYASPALNARRVKTTGRVRPFTTKLPKYLYEHTSEAGKLADTRRREQRLRDLILSERDFLRADSATLPGARNNARELAKVLGVEYDSLTLNQQRKFWEAYEKFRKDNPELIRSMDKEFAYENARKNLFSIVVTHTKTGLQVRTDDKMLNYIKKIYEKKYESIMKAKPDDSPLQQPQGNDGNSGLPVAGDEEEGVFTRIADRKRKR